MQNFDLKTALGRFRLIAILEGISYVILVFISMPLKYFGNFPEAVKYNGWLHGILFVPFCFLLLHAWIIQKWSFIKAVLAFFASLIPFGTFVFDRAIKNETAIKN
ncbi:MAG: DUF3817 domain-containing protein [Sphingobacteriales bacterium]|nr:MAG: DUF3817 domain-containing protein [Sphingobacteriales bacterium]